MCSAPRQTSKRGARVEDGIGDGPGPQPLAGAQLRGELGDRRRAERGEGLDPRGRLARQLPEEAALTELARTGPDHDADRLVGQAAGQVDEEAQEGSLAQWASSTTSSSGCRSASRSTSQ